MAEIKELVEEKLAIELQKIAKAYRATIFDDTIRKKHKKFTAFLKAKGGSDPVKKQKHIALTIHESIRRQIQELALLQFLLMEKKNDYGQMGEQRVAISFCRNILDIPPKREVNQDDADLFREKIDIYEKKLNISASAKLQEKVSAFTVDLLGEKYSLAKNDELNMILDFLGVPYRLFVGTMKTEFSFIYGKIEPKEIAGKKVNIIGKEIVRSPHYVLSIAAGQGSAGIFIRHESCETIFYNKWASFFNVSSFEKKLYLAHPHSAIREGLKEQALKHYGITSTEQAENSKELFIQEMIEGIFYHEIGHLIGEEGKVPLEEAMIGKSRGVVGDDIVVVLKEAIADWSPQQGKASGPVWAFLQKAKKDETKASRLFYVYLSDNWFIDSDDEFMGIQTDVLCSLILAFIGKEGVIDFKQMQQEFPKYYEFVLNIYIKTLSQVNQILLEGVYMAGIHRINFETLEKELVKVYAKEHPEVTRETLRTKPSYWIHLIGLASKFSPDVQKKIDEYIKESSLGVKREILNLVSAGQADKYQGSLRQYILDKMAMIGIYKQQKLPASKEVLSGIAKDIKLPMNLTKKVFDRYNQIISGQDSMDIAISYEGKPDPFWVIFQELLIRSGLGNIRSGMALGENINMKDSLEEKKKKSKEALENIRDQIESEMYLDVKLLRVNAEYLEQKIFDEVLGQVKFFDDSPLKEKINSVQFIGFKTKRIMEAYISLKRGFVDWNTSQAIWRINQEIRSDDYLKQWTIDAELLKTVFDAYLASASH
ncbi:hypothetical protein ACFL5G_05895 [Candidatus Margulisiibacteriota bacterium]